MKTLRPFVVFLGCFNIAQGQIETSNSDFQLLSASASDLSDTNQLVEIRKDDNQGSFGEWGFVYTDTEFRATRESLLDIIRKLNPHDDLLLFDEANLPRDKYDLKLQSAARENCWKMFEQILREKFNAAVNVRTRAKEVYELQIVTNAGPKLVSSVENEAHTFATTPAGFSFKAYSMEDLAAYFNNDSLLSPKLDLPVFNRTRLKGGFSFTLNLTPFSSKPEIIQALNQVGLTLKAATNTMAVLVVERLN